MRKKSLLVVLATLLLAIPALANAWTLTVKVTGGSLTPANTVVLTGGVSKTITSGTSTFYPSTATTVSVNTAGGSTSTVILDGFPAPASFSLSSGSHTVAVSYSAPVSSSLAITQGSGGAISVLLPNSTWTSTGTTGLPAGTSLRYSIAADGSHTIASYTVNGATTTVNGSTAGQIVTGTFSTVPGNNTITASYAFAASITGSLSTPTNGYTTLPVNCAATASSNDTGLRYAFNVTGPAPFSQPASPSQSFSFTPLLAGTYTVTATITSDHGGSFTTQPAQVTVTSNQANLNGPCISCHSTQSPAIVSAYQATTLHNRSAGSTCVACHTADTPHAAGVNAESVDAVNFGVKTAGTAGLALGASFCVKCHDATIDTAYQTSPHKAVPLTCSSCHPNGVHNVDFSATPVRPYADDSFLNRDLAASNVCLSCHSGSKNGASIQAKVGSADFGNLPFVAPSADAAGGTLQGVLGYHFPGQTYNFYTSNGHRIIGRKNQFATGSSGSCVGCHMSSPAKHSHQAVTQDASGNITAIASGACVKCHAAYLDVPRLSAGQASFDNALLVLKAMLADKGFTYTAAAPNFTNTNWGSGQAGANVMGAAYNYAMLVKEPGAYAHNGAYARKLIADSVDLLYNGTVTGSITSALSYLKEKGAISQAQVDSMTSYQAATGCTACHTNTSGSHPKHLARSVGCADCHSATAASSSALLTGTTNHINGVNDVSLAAGGSYAAGTCSNVYCHSNGAGTYTTPAWGVGSANCAFCHPIAALRGAHAAHVGTLVPSGYGSTADNSTAEEYRFGCGSCHPTGWASHRNGSVEVTLVPTADGSLRSKNRPDVVVSGIGNTGSGIAGTSRVSVTCSAAYCHSNGGVGAALAYLASPDWYGGAYSGDRCAMCHGNAPATGAHAKHAVSIHTGLVTNGAGELTLGHGDTVPATVISCDLCHATAVTNHANDANAACASCHAGNAKGTPMLDKTVHLNGTLDLVFRDVKVVTKAQVRPTSFSSYSGIWTRTSYKSDADSYDRAKLSLNQAVFGADKSCANVACHNGAVPKWSDRLTCVSCHSKL